MRVIGLFINKCCGWDWCLSLTPIWEVVEPKMIRTCHECERRYQEPQELEQADDNNLCFSLISLFLGKNALHKSLAKDTPCYLWHKHSLSESQSLVFLSLYDSSFSFFVRFTRVTIMLRLEFRSFKAGFVLWFLLAFSCVSVAVCLGCSRVGHSSALCRGHRCS